MKPNIGLAEKGRKEVGRLLNILLADEVALYLKTRNFHWNVTGPHFHDLHKFFESQYEALDEILDEVAERVRSLGHPAFGSLREFGEHARNKEQAGAELTAKAMVGQLLSDHEAVIRRLRVDAETANKFGDAGTNDFLVGLIEEHEKMAWMLRATVTA